MKKNKRKKSNTNIFSRKIILPLLMVLSFTNPSYAYKINKDLSNENINTIGIKNSNLNTYNNWALDQEKLAASLINVGDKEENQKNPFLAAGLSFIIPGAGQVYNEEYIKGALLFVGVVGLAALNFLVIEPKAKEYETANLKLPEAQRTTNSLFDLGALITRVSLPTLWVYNWGSAYQSADPEYQKKMKLEEEKKSQSNQTTRNILEIKLVKIHF